MYHFTVILDVQLPMSMFHKNKLEKIQNFTELKMEKLELKILILQAIQPLKSTIKAILSLNI